MTTQQLEQTTVGGRRIVGGWLIGFALVARWLARAGLGATGGVAQPVVGRAITVTGLVFDGTRYVNAPITIGATMEQPVVGRAITVTGLVFDGTRYVNAPISRRGATRRTRLRRNCPGLRRHNLPQRAGAGRRALRSRGWDGNRTRTITAPVRNPPGGSRISAAQLSLPIRLGCGIAIDERNRPCDSEY